MGRKGRSNESVVLPVLPVPHLWIRRIWPWPLPCSSSQHPCCRDNAQPLVHISPSCLGHLAFGKRVCVCPAPHVPFHPCWFMEQPFSAFWHRHDTAVGKVSVGPWPTCCCKSYQFLALQQVYWGAGGFVPEVSSLVPWFEFPRLNDILNLCYIFTL